MESFSTCRVESNNSCRLITRFIKNKQLFPNKLWHFRLNQGQFIVCTTNRGFQFHSVFCYGHGHLVDASTLIWYSVWNERIKCQLWLPTLAVDVKQWHNKNLLTLKAVTKPNVYTLPHTIVSGELMPAWLPHGMNKIYTHCVVELFNQTSTPRLAAVAHMLYQQLYTLFELLFINFNTFTRIGQKIDCANDRLHLFCHCCESC